jgi:hypothetical protein
MPGLPTLILVALLCVDSCLTTLLIYTFALPLPSSRVSQSYESFPDWIIAGD